MGQRRALYVGINAYDHHPTLKAAAEDALRMAQALEFEGTGADSPRRNWPAAGKALLVTSESRPRVKKQDLLARINTLFNSAVGDEILFYFAGHGFETDDGLLLATTEDDPAGARAGVTVESILERVTGSRVNSATIILDCCQAGAAAALNVSRNVAIIAGAGSDQAAAEFGERGLFTRFLLDGLQGGAADTLGVITALSLYSYAAGVLSYLKDQEPVIKANIEELVVLQRTKGKISLTDLRRLSPSDGSPGMFSTTKSRNPVSPDHEATQAQSVPPLRSRPHPMPVDLTPEQQDMDYYKRLRNAGLLETVDGGDLFWTCLHGGEVRLTALGRYYWELADQGLI